MSILKVITVPDKRLSKKAMKVKKFDDNLKKFANDLIETMNSDNAAGIASIQVDDDPRFKYDNVPEEFRPQPSVIIVNIEDLIVAVNAEIIWYSEQKEIGIEGCMSIPNLPVKVERHTQIHVKYNDLEGNEHIYQCKPGDESICFQHEIDHLNGIITPDHSNAMQQMLLWKKFEQINSMLKYRR